VAAEVRIDFGGRSDSRDAGIVFRCSGQSIGYDAQRGYFAGLIPRTNLVILGKTDGDRWTELARAKTEINVRQPQQLAIRVKGDQIQVHHNGQKKIALQDATYVRGSIGLRVVDAEVRFSNFNVRSAE
jgi:hypothetical protein